jgi:hypothetical protein
VAPPKELRSVNHVMSMKALPVMLKRALKRSGRERIELRK